MAINITAEITGQEITSVFTYCYLYEPLRILIEETNLAATKMYIDIEKVHVSILCLSSIIVHLCHDLCHDHTAPTPNCKLIA